MVSTQPSIGLPKMHLEPGERRVFLPDFIAALHEVGFSVLLEDDYGSSIGLTEADYSNLSDQVVFSNLDTVYQQEHVLVLRYPGDALVRKLQPGACLISMLHYPTRPQRVELLTRQKVQAISLDTIINDTGKRMVENLPSVAWNGMRISMQELSKVYPEPGFSDPQRPMIRVTLIGAGAVGQHVIQAAVAYGDPQLRAAMLKQGIPGVMVQVVDYDLTGQAD